MVELDPYLLSEWINLNFVVYPYLPLPTSISEMYAHFGDVIFIVKSESDCERWITMSWIGTYIYHIALQKLYYRYRLYVCIFTFHFSVTCNDQDTYRAAMKNPEQYDLVRVRTGGWSEFYISFYSPHQVCDIWQSFLWNTFMSWLSSPVFKTYIMYRKPQQINGSFFNVLFFNFM